jgi:hypothetical protein
MHIGPELLSLCRETGNFNSRNVLEVIALLEGIKPAMRLVVDLASHNLIKYKLRSLKLFTVRSRWNIKASYKTPLGDVYTSLTDKNDPESDSFVLMVASSRKTAEEAMHLEDNGEDSGELEKLLGYPDCCVKSYRNICETRDWLEELLSNTRRQMNYSWASNRIAYLFDENSLFFDYFPCSLGCTKTAEISRNIWGLAPLYGIKDICDKWRQEMCRPVLIRKGVIVQMKEYRFNDHSSCLEFNPRKISLHGWKVADRADEDFTWESDSIKRDSEELRFFKNGKFTGSFLEEITDNRLLTFKKDVS